MDNGTATSLGSKTADPDIAANTTEGYADYELTITATSVTLKNLGTGSAVTSADTTHRLGGVWELSTLWSVQNAYISRVTVEDLP